MNTTEIFLLQLAMSVGVFSLIFIGYGRNWLRRLGMKEALFWLTLPHAFRHIGLVFEVPGVVSPDLPIGFSTAAAYGDLASAGIAIMTLVALKTGLRIAIPLAWLLTVVGTVDLVYALSHVEVIPLLEAAWYIPTFLVPLLLVSHAATAVLLLLRPVTASKPLSAE